ncbi:hypothetical protein ASG22_10265 [Chryseobacterium sp. Leaf405]|uniref:energy transducer TonB n=1 Tax=Chryseobacterium sp. Leaf405 TaxID=1736367 RepID=UPI0006FF545B|nr:energy transducer TonB [Chryseobacterium sp. Leaf405]KQT24386.1 hypothetical protein ASG22_10265 [Chryseobacterium sp. Leaf405]
MKKILTIALFFAFGITFSQTKTENKDTSKDIYVPQADVQPDFPGGITNFRNIIAKNINLNKVKGPKGRINSSAKFAVNIKGEIEQITVVGSNEDFNKEIEKVIKSVALLWKPATYKGQPVKYWFQIPFTGYLE